MNTFFQELDKVMDGGVILSMSVVKNDGKLTVSIIPQPGKGSSTLALVPLMATGTALELDEEFVPSMMAPLQKVAGMVVNTAKFEESATKKATVATPSRSSLAAPAKVKTLKERMLELSDKFDKEKKYKEAADVLDQLYSVEKTNEIFFKCSTARKKVPAPSLFEAEPEAVTIPDYVAMVGGLTPVTEPIVENEDDDNEDLESQTNPEFTDENEESTDENPEE